MEVHLRQAGAVHLLKYRMLFAVLVIELNSITSVGNDACSDNVESVRGSANIEPYV